MVDINWSWLANWGSTTYHTKFKTNPAMWRSNKSKITRLRGGSIDENGMDESQVTESVEHQSGRAKCTDRVATSVIKFYDYIMG